jgi:cell division protease FtsH
MGSACEEVLLNKLLNEMDGLREDAEVIFILTTNRPQNLEVALSSRPGRIDQAIEFPLPDPAGRKQLVHLYSCGLQLHESVVQEIVRRTEGASGAFIKELMRRSAQFHFHDSPHGDGPHGDGPRGDGKVGLLGLDHVAATIDELLLAGGSLNVKLLGGPASS